jgi:TolB-like protein
MLYIFGEFTFDTARFEICRQNRPLDIEPQALRTLKYLIENRDRVVSRSEIHRALWGRRRVTDNAVSVVIRSVRRALDDTGDVQAVIKTARGAGYRFVAELDCATSLSINGNQKGLASGRIQASSLTDRQAAKVSDRALIGKPSIAVLCFESINGDDNESVFARGLAHDIITRIARSRTMLIIARGSAFRLDAAEYDVADIGNILGVRYLVQGAVQFAKSRVRIFVALVNSLTGEEIWSEQFVRRMGEFMQIQEEITELIVGLVESRVQHEEFQRSLLAPSANLDAWSLLHRGLYHLFLFKRKDCDTAERLFRRSIELEPNVPRAYAGLSFVHFERVFMHYEERRSNSLAQAFECAEQCLALDPLDPMGHWVLARAHLLKAELDKSKTALDRAIELNPSYANARYSLGWVAMHLGEYELCRDSIESAVKLSPFDPFMYAMQGVLALNLALMGQTEAAVALARDSVQQPNAHWQANAFAAVTHAIGGDLTEARKLYAKARRVAPTYDVEQFFSVFPFQQDSDVRRIRRAFTSLGSTRLPH